MRGLLIFTLLAGCGDPAPPAPVDPEAFCRAREREPGWTCDDFAGCETAYAADGTSVCHARSDQRARDPERAHSSSGAQ